jgi:Pin2-interacting protein X1
MNAGCRVGSKKMGLAQKRVKRSIPSDPRNLRWSNNEETFGFRMMEKMGWKRGLGLGAMSHGRTDALSAHMKQDMTGH